MVKKSKQVFSILLVIGGAFGCVPKEELDAEDLEPSLDWEDIMSHHESESENAVSSAATVAPILSKKNAIERDIERGRRSILGNIESATPYAGGILGLKGSSKYFVASTSTIPEYDRLYWVIVKVLSEKYSCFIKAKQDIGLLTRFTCRDKRQVLFWKKRSGQFIEFTSRQFDRDGFEIKVVRKQIVRISNHKVI